MKYKGIRRDTLDIPNNPIEVVWGVEFDADEKEPEVQRALRAGTIEAVAVVTAKKKKE
jgi:hypothetical protein